ncbi:hypothetical protein [Nocardia lasii]|uniref:Uncharacterized protein n=1 Tax=Nocardia lasii TaxID=1616107 RepID=A0ABW1JWL4_9NOCA
MAQRAIVVTVACVVGAARLLWPRPGLDEQPGSTQRQLAFVRDALDEGSDTAAQQLFPEGYLFSNVLYGLTWVQAAHTDPGLREGGINVHTGANVRPNSASTHHECTFMPLIGLASANPP